MGVFGNTISSVQDADVIQGFPPDQDDWGCNTWIIYYQRIKNKFGKVRAKEAVLLDIDNIGFWSDWQLCEFDCTYIIFFEREGFDLSIDPLTRTICSTDKAFEDAGEVLTDITTGAKRITKVAKFGAPILAVVALGFLAFTAFQFIPKPPKRKALR